MSLRWILLSLLATACGSPRIRTDLQDHVLAFDKRGRLVDPYDRDRLDVAEREAYFDNVLRRAEERCDSFCRLHVPEEESDVRRVLIHVHGGMNRPSASIRRASRIVDALDRDERERPQDWHYPIFVQWPSGPVGTYGDHLLHIRQGRWTRFWGPATAPVFLVTDFARGLARLPRSAAYQYAVDVSVGFGVAFRKPVLSDWRNMVAIDAAVKECKSEGDHECSYSIAHGEYRRGFLNQAGRFVAYWLTQPTKLFVQTFLLDGMGRGAWDTMMWRTRALFWQPDTFDVRDLEDDPEKLRATLGSAPNGHLVEFLTRFRERARKEKERARAGGRDLRYEITLVGHSMGAIVLNDALPFIEGSDVARIVYMAPACSIRDAAQAVVPFLEENREATFHVLTLHPVAEADERNGWDLPPRGSLLEWIDNWYTTPSSHPDRRLGKWINVVQALPLFHSVRERFFVKAFGVDVDTLPQKHAQFNDCPFWRDEFRDLAGPFTYAADWNEAGDSRP